MSEEPFLHVSLFLTGISTVYLALLLVLRLFSETSRCFSEPRNKSERSTFNFTFNLLISWDCRTVLKNADAMCLFLSLNFACIPITKLFWIYIRRLPRGQGESMQAHNRRLADIFRWGICGINTNHWSGTRTGKTPCPLINVTSIDSCVSWS